MAPPSNVHRCLLQSDALDAVRSWTNEIASWPAGSHVWGHYAEVTDSGPAICRTENVSACHGGYSGLVNGLLRDVAAEALGQPVTDFKDKINYKQPGGAGFRPHQDVVAYPDAGTVMSVLVAIDDCTEESGCIWLADGITTVLETDDRGVVREDIATELNWYPVALAAGDAVCLDGFAPHFSDANRSREQRRVLVASYAATDEHYTRDHYYSARRATMSSASGKDGRFRISTLADFCRGRGSARPNRQRRLHALADLGVTGHHREGSYREAIAAARSTTVHRCRRGFGRLTQPVGRAPVAQVDRAAAF